MPPSVSGVLPNTAVKSGKIAGGTREKEQRVILAVLLFGFLLFLGFPMVLLLAKSVQGTGEITLAHYIEVFSSASFLRSVGNSLTVAASAGGVTVGLAFLLACTVNCTNLPVSLKRSVRLLTQLPMLLPTITYGFAIIYSFGRQGLLTRLFGRQLFDIYGFSGLLIGYVVYTLPTAFLLMDNTFQYVDPKFQVVSRLMGDSGIVTFIRTVLRPLAGTLCVAFVQAFFLSFTDYGIPTSVGGQYQVVALELYNEMLGSIPNFGNGAVVALTMLLPSLISITLLGLLERSNIRYNRTVAFEIPKSKLRDSVLGGLSGVVLLVVLSLFAVIFVVPFVEMWPFKLQLTLSHITGIFQSGELLGVYKNSLFVAFLSAVFGSLVAYGAALVTTRSHIRGPFPRLLDAVSSVINTIPGMVLGIAYLFAFSGTPLQNTFGILIVCNILHYFSSPYQMMKDSLSKMNSSWETTAKLMGDSWIKTILRVVTPNAGPTILQVFSYYFVNSMVTVSAVVFLTGALTMVITTKISSLQHLAKFDDIFVLSLLILSTNLAVKGVTLLLAKRKKDGTRLQLPHLLKSKRSKS